MTRPRIAFVTGKLAEPAMRAMARELQATCGIDPTVIVLNIQVAALLTAEWVAKKLELPGETAIDKVVLPGHCRGDLAMVSDKLGLPVEAGPMDLHDLPETFGKRSDKRKGYGDHRIEIIAEINHAARLPLERILAMAARYRTAGADVIDVGCDPQAERDAWQGVGEVVRQLKAAGHRVSIDTFHPREVELAAAAGAELVLSVNSTNRDIAAAWGIEVVAIPDTPADLASLDATIELLSKRNVPLRLDPIIEPIGFGFAASLRRYAEVRERYPQLAMMMGVGNLSEMTEVDSAGLNAMLIGICEELSVGSVLTTEVINWARSSVAEIDVARQLMHHAIRRQSVPKHLDSRLVMLRDAKLRGFTPVELQQIAQSLTDRNVRLFAIHDEQGGTLHAMSRDFHLTSRDAFELFDAMAQRGDFDPSHAFYIGYELAKATTALTLGKNYTQDKALQWGMLTREEVSHHERKKRENPGLEGDSQPPKGEIG
jgi:dihydropteroate synthase